MDTPSPDAWCPPLAQTRSAVDSRLGTIELEGTWRATYVLVHRESGDVVLLKLRDPSGRVRLERELVAKDGTCATLAQVIALMLERYFLRPEANVEGPTSGEISSTDPSSVQSRPQERASNTHEPNSGIAPRIVDPKMVSTPLLRRTDLALSYTLDASLWVSSAWVAPSMGFVLPVSGRSGIGLLGAFDLTDHAQRIANGWGQSRRIPLALQAKQRLLAGPLRLDLSAEFLGLYEHVHTLGLLENGSGGRFVPGAGLRAGTEFLPRGVRPFAEITSSFVFPSLSRPFEIDHRSAFTLRSFVIGFSFGIRTPL